MSPSPDPLFPSAQERADWENFDPTNEEVGGLGPLRYGQALFNDVYRVAPDRADRIRGTDADPFYLDERVPDFLRALLADGSAADSEQRRLAEWVLANCPGEPSQDGGVVDTVIRLITSARADGAAEERERIVALAFGQAQRVDGSWIDPDGSRAMAQALVSFAHDVDHGAVAGEGTECQDSTIDHLTEWIGGRT